MKKTYIYVDGFNLYYGSVKKTPYKWLNIKKLFEYILSEEHEIKAIKYYTTKVTGRTNPHSPGNQRSYIRALKEFIPEISIYYGHYLSHKAKMPLAANNKLVEVIKTEEKGSDVNLAVHLLNDAWKNEFDCAVIVSNDSDLAESISIVKKDHRKMIGIITPGDPKVRKTTKLLKENAHFIKRIRKNVLSMSQLPLNIPGTNIYKPKEW